MPLVVGQRHRRPERARYTDLIALGVCERLGKSAMSQISTLEAEDLLSKLGAGICKVPTL